VESDSVLTKLLKKALMKKALSGSSFTAPLSPDSGLEEDCEPIEAVFSENPNEDVYSEKALESVYSEIYQGHLQPPIPVKSSTLRPPARPPYPASAAVSTNT